jgi:hypothetical protein
MYASLTSAIQPFKAVPANEKQARQAADQKGLLQIVAATRSGMVTGDFSKSVLDRLGTAQHPRFNRPYDGVIYQPIQELRAYLPANGWSVVDMKQDWKTVFPDAPAREAKP